jgi:hypothetical protein
MASNDGSNPRASESYEAARRQRRIGWTMTLVLGVIYFTYLFSVVLAPEAMSVPIGGNLTPGLLLGAGVIFAALILATWYVAQANRNDADTARRS